MSWRLLTGPRSKKEERELDKRTAKRTRFLVDEALGVGVARWLQVVGYNTQYGPDYGLGGKADQCVFAYAWREERLLLTHDKDYLNDKEFPFHRNPGVIVLPGENGEEQPLFLALRTMLNIFGRHGGIFPNAKIVIDSSNVWNVRNYRKADGYIERGMLKFTKYHVYRWED